MLSYSIRLVNALAIYLGRESSRSFFYISPRGEREREIIIVEMFWVLLKALKKDELKRRKPMLFLIAGLGQETVECPSCGGGGGFTCSACYGSGYELGRPGCCYKCKGTRLEQCHRCGGTGKIMQLKKKPPKIWPLSWPRWIDIY